MSQNVTYNAVVLVEVLVEPVRLRSADHAATHQASDDETSRDALSLDLWGANPVGGPAWDERERSHQKDAHQSGLGCL